MKTIAQKMIKKFEKYLSDFCTILAIAVILDPQHKMTFIEFAYNKSYGQNSEDLKHVRDKLFSVFGEYNLIIPSSSTTSVLEWVMLVQVRDTMTIVKIHLTKWPWMFSRYIYNFLFVHCKTYYFHIYFGFWQFLFLNYFVVVWWFW